MPTNWSLFAAVVTVLALVVAALGHGEDVENEQLAALPWRVVVANAAFSQALFGLLTLGGVWMARVPLSTLGIGGFTPRNLGLGVGLGLVLAGANAALSKVVDAADLSYAEKLRELLTPGTLPGWAALLFGVLPLVAVAEELLFRGALVAALAAGFPVSPWLLALVASLVFGVAHGAQGAVGVGAAAGLGFVLAASLVVTGSLLVPAVAHYLVNAVEFVAPAVRAD